MTAKGKAGVASVRVVWAVAIGIVLGSLAPFVASASNWGAGHSGFAGRLCSDFSDPNFQNSECTANDSSHYLYITSIIHPDLGNALEKSIEEDYNPIFGLYAVVQGTVTSSTDAIVWYTNDFPNEEITFGTCQYGSEKGLIGIQYHMWCRPHIIVFQDSNAAENSCWDIGACRRHYACHEIGHTLGLMHPGSGGDESCMSLDESPHPENLRNHDEEHLTDCYPHPTLPLPTFEAETRTNLCKYNQ